MDKSMVDHTAEEFQLSGSSLRNPFGSDFDGADSPPPVYSEEEGHPQSMFLLANQDVKSPPIVLQYTPPTGSTELEPASSVAPNRLGPSTCVVCMVSPYSKGGVSYPTCRAHTKMRRVPSLNLAGNQTQTGITPSSASPSEISYSVKQPNRSRGSAGQMKMCDVCHLRPRAQKAGKTYPTCGLTCATALKNTGPNSQGNALTLDLLTKSYESLRLSPSDHHSSGTQQQDKTLGFFQSLRGKTSTQTATTCVVCLVKPCSDRRFVTCGIECTETLCTRGSSNPKMCDFCHRQPKSPGHNQCSKTCRDNASTACLLCRSRPRFGRYDFCGRTCKMIAFKKTTPLILEVRPGHITYNEVEPRFKRAWKGSGVCPSIKKVYKIIENQSFLLPFDKYRKRVGNAEFRYHGTLRRCTLGSPGNTRLCPSTACALCSILRTSFKISQFGPFGAGVYTSSAANEAYRHSHGGKGAIILTEVVLGTAYKAKARDEVKSCPPGYNSVVFKRQNGKLDETTVVYTDDAIRPVFLIIF